MHILSNCLNLCAHPDRVTYTQLHWRPSCSKWFSFFAVDQPAAKFTLFISFLNFSFSLKLPFSTLCSKSGSVQLFVLHALEATTGERWYRQMKATPSYIKDCGGSHTSTSRLACCEVTTDLHLIQWYFCCVAVTEVLFFSSGRFNHPQWCFVIRSPPFPALTVCFLSVYNAFRSARVGALLRLAAYVWVGNQAEAIPLFACSILWRTGTLSYPVYCSLYASLSFSLTPLSISPLSCVIRIQPLEEKMSQVDLELSLALKTSGSYPLLTIQYVHILTPAYVMSMYVCVCVFLECDVYPVSSPCASVCLTYSASCPISHWFLSWSVTVGSRDMSDLFNTACVCVCVLRNSYCQSNVIYLSITVLQST